MAGQVGLQRAEALAWPGSQRQLPESGTQTVLLIGEVFNRKERSQGHSRPCQSIYTPTQAAGRGPRALICKSSLSDLEIGARYVTWGKPKICDLGRGIAQGSQQCVELPPFTSHSLPCVPFDHSGELGTPSTLGPCGPGHQQPSLRLPPGHGEAGS